MKEEDITVDNEIKDPKFIVLKCRRMTMLCSCGLEVKLETSVVGTSLVVNDIFPDGHVLHWQSQPMVRDMAAGSLLLSAAILFCGLTFTGIASLADLLNLAMLSERQRLQRFAVL